MIVLTVGTFALLSLGASYMVCICVSTYSMFGLVVMSSFELVLVVCVVHSN